MYGGKWDLGSIWSEPSNSWYTSVSRVYLLLRYCVDAGLSWLIPQAPLTPPPRLAVWLTARRARSSGCGWLNNTSLRVFHKFISTPVSYKCQCRPRSFDRWVVTLEGKGSCWWGVGWGSWNSPNKRWSYGHFILFIYFQMYLKLEPLERLVGEVRPVTISETL